MPRLRWLAVENLQSASLNLIYAKTGEKNALSRSNLQNSKDGLCDGFIPDEPLKWDSMDGSLMGEWDGAWDAWFSQEPFESVDTEWASQKDFWESWEGHLSDQL